jgi:hypothetical protein
MAITVSPRDGFYCKGKIMAVRKKRVVTFDDDVLVNGAEAAHLLGTTKEVLQKWRCRPGPKIPYVKIGAGVRYKVKDLKAFVEQNTCSGKEA